jgi:WD40 repeat protein
LDLGSKDGRAKPGRSPSQEAQELSPVQVLSIGKSKRVHAVAFSPDGAELATVSGDRTARVWNLATGEVRLTTSVEETSCGYDLAYLDERRVVFAGTQLSLWDTEADEWHLIAAGAAWGRRVKISPGGEYLVEVDQTRSTDWEGGPGLQLRSTNGWVLQEDAPRPEFTTGGAAFSTDGKLLATAHMAAVGERTRTVGAMLGLNLEFQVNEYDYLVHVREMPTGRILKTIAGWQQAVTHLAFSPDGAVLAGTAGPRLRIWDLQSDRELALHKRGTKHFQGLSFARDGSFLATVSNDTTVRIWEPKTWQEYTKFKWDIGALLNITFAPDGLRIAAGSDKGKVIIWDAQ